MSVEANTYSWFIEQAQRKHGEDLQFLGLHTKTLPKSELTLEVDKRLWRVVPVRSTLQARRAMVQAGDSGRCLIVTPLGREELGDEVVMRLGYQRLESPQPWQYVREMFRAQRVDPRLHQHAWMADFLLAHRPASGYPAAAGGMLSLEFVWDVLASLVGLEDGRPTVAQVFSAAVEGALGGRWSTLEPEFRRDMAVYWTERGEQLLPLFVPFLDAGRGRDLVAIGLVLEVVVADAIDPEQRGALRERVATELGAARPDPALCREWAKAARRWCDARVEESGMDAVREQLERAEVLLVRLGCRPDSVFSTTLRSGLAASKREFSAALAEALTAGSEPSGVQRVEATYARVAEHFVAKNDEGQKRAVERARSALRLVRWLSTSSRPANSLAEAALNYRDESAWVDRARHALAAGEADAGLKAAYDELGARITRRREKENQAFADLLARVFAGREGAGEIRRLERVLDEVAAPLAKACPVLLVVMDGMSQAVFQQLAEDLGRRTSFQRMAPQSEASWNTVIAPLPSVTEVCRTSLLCGELTVGGQREELRGLEEVAQRHRWRGSKATSPILFHKANLRESDDTTPHGIGAAIDGDDRVVAVVINAVDDQLPKGDQLRPDWTLHIVPDLEFVVSRAEAAGRAIVLTADHGHVVDIGSSGKESVGDDRASERWRKADRPAGAGEIEVRGERVALPVLKGPVVVPWSETVRYSGRHNGYHGGAAPQEVVVPFGVFVPSSSADAISERGWQREVVHEPSWWSERVVDVGGVAEQPAKKKIAPPQRSTKPTPQPTLFVVAESPDAAKSSVAKRVAWIDALLASEVFKAQRKFAGRHAVNEEEVVKVLGALHSSSCVATFDRLCQQTGLVERRLRLMLVPLARLLNVDGYSVLTVDLGSSTVTLNRVVLADQFGIRVE